MADVSGLLPVLKRERPLVLGCTAVAAARLAYVVLLFSYHRLPVVGGLFLKVAPRSVRDAGSTGWKPGPDVRKFDDMARQIAAGKTMHYGAPDDVLVPAPMFPYLLGGLYALFGPHPAMVLVLYALLDAATALLLILLYRMRSGPPDRRGELAFLLLFAVYVPYITVVMLPLTECLFIFFITLFFLTLQNARFSGTLRSVVWAGIALGAAVLTRPVVLLFPAWMAAWDLLRRRPFTVTARLYGIIALVMVLCAVPWTVRNYLHYGRFIPITSTLKSVSRGADPSSSGGETGRESTDHAALNLNDNSVVGMYVSKFGAMLASPGKTVAFWAVKAARLWFNLGYPRAASAGSWATALLHALLFAAAVTALVRMPGLRGVLEGPFLYFLYISFFHVVFFTAKIRYVMPAMPVFVLAAAVYLSAHGRSGVCPEAGV